MPNPPRRRSRTTSVLSTLLGLSLPVLLVAALWLWEWRYAATALIAGATAAFLAGNSTHRRPWPAREEL